MSIFISFIVVMVLTISIITIVNINKNKHVYANSIKFASMSSGIELYIDNEIVLDNNLITVIPGDCTFTPQFTIKESGATDEIAISNASYSFEEAGKYVLTCKVKANKNYFTQDTLLITVVENPTPSTTMHIKELNMATLYVGDEIDVASLATITHPSLANINFDCSEHITANYGIVTAIKNGLGVLDINITYDNITISKTIFIIVKPKIAEDAIKLDLTLNGTPIENNIIAIDNTKFTCNLTYELLNCDNQLINCWTDSSIVSILSYNSPNIVLKPISVGEATVYVSPADYPNIIFEITIRISE